MEVKRYSLQIYQGVYPHMDQTENGEYVRYSDIKEWCPYFGTCKDDTQEADYCHQRNTRPAADVEGLVDRLIHLVKTQCKSFRRHGLTEEIADARAALLTALRR